MINLRKISLFIVLLMLINLVSGCFSKDSKNKIFEFTVTEENPVVSHEDITIEFSPYDINEETKITVAEIKPPDLFSDDVLEQDLMVATYDIKASKTDEFIDLISISIPYDESFIEVGDVLNNVGAMYYDESLKEWTPVAYEIDEASKKVIITTNHLSIYSVYTIKNENSRTAHIIQVNSFPTLPSDISSTYQAVIQEAMENQMTPGQKATELGLSMSGDFLGISGSALTTITQTVYSTEFLQGLGNVFTNIGLAAAFVQAAYDFSSGDNTKLFTNLTKNLSYFSVSKWGSNALQLSFVGVYAIDYSINKFAEAAWDGRKEIWYQAYKTYYKEENKRTYKDWYTKLFWICQDNKNSKDPNVLRNKINEALDEYTNAFWNLNEEEQAFWQSEVQKTGFSGGGGLNEKLKKEIAAAAKAELVSAMQETVFNRLEQTMRHQLTDEYKKEIIALKNYLNQKTNVLITEGLKENEKSEYAGYIVRFAPLNDNANPANWTGKIKDDGTVRTVFTVLGHIQSGAPNQLLLFEPDANPDTDEPVKSIDFVVSFPETQIYLKEMIPTMDEIAGVWTKVHMIFVDVQIPEPTNDDESECDITAEILESIKTMKLTCRIEIEKIDKENANFSFGITSGINTKTGEALDIEPNPPMLSTAKYKDGILTTTLEDEKMIMYLALPMKKNPDGSIVFDYFGVLTGKGEETASSDSSTLGNLKFNINGKKD